VISRHLCLFQITNLIYACNSYQKAARHFISATSFPCLGIFHGLSVPETDASTGHMASRSRWEAQLSQVLDLPRSLAVQMPDCPSSPRFNYGTFRDKGSCRAGPPSPRHPGLQRRERSVKGGISPQEPRAQSPLENRELGTLTSHLEQLASCDLPAKSLKRPTGSMNRVTPSLLARSSLRLRIHLLLGHPVVQYNTMHYFR